MILLNREKKNIMKIISRNILIPLKMRRNLKFVVLLSVSWMFVMLYYFQASNTKVRYLYLEICFIYKLYRNINLIFFFAL